MQSINETFHGQGAMTRAEIRLAELRAIGHRVNLSHNGRHWVIRDEARSFAMTKAATRAEAAAIGTRYDLDHRA